MEEEIVLGEDQLICILTGKIVKATEKLNIFLNPDDFIVLTSIP